MAIGIKTILKLRNVIPLQSRLRQLESLVLSHLHYSAVLFCALSKIHIKKLDRQINWALKSCYFVGKYCSDRFTTCIENFTCKTAN